MKARNLPASVPAARRLLATLRELTDQTRQVPSHLDRVANRETPCEDPICEAVNALQDAMGGLTKMWAMAEALEAAIEAHEAHKRHEATMEAMA